MATVKHLFVGLLLFFSFNALGATFTFTAIPDENTSQSQARFEKLADYLEGELGVEVKYLPVTSYAAAVEAFKNNQIQLAWFGGLSGLQARRLVPGSKAIAQGFEDQFFKSYFIAHTSADILPSDDFPNLNGYTFTFGDKDSTSGRLMPQFYIERNLGKTTENIFKQVGYSDDHAQTIKLVESGAYQIGVVNYKVWESAVANGTVDLSKVKVIWETPAYPNYQWTLRHGVDKTFGHGFSERVKDTLLEINDPEILSFFPRQSFVETSNRTYAPIEIVAKVIGVLD